jgi:uncharacterized protein
VTSLIKPGFFWSAFSDHARHTATAARFLIAMLEGIEQRDSLAETIRNLHQRGEAIARRTIQVLHATDITPIDRDVIYLLMRKLDDVLNALEAVSERIAVYEICEIRSEALDMARVLASSADKILEATTMLTHARNDAALMNVCREIGAREQDADRILSAALIRLFREGCDPIEIVKWRDVFEAMEMATDRADDVANTIESIVLDRV